jgi:hypothetical protein
MSLKRRLARLQDAARGEASPDGREPWAPPHVYRRLIEDAKEEIATSAAHGEEPLYRVDGGIIFAADTGLPIRHGGGLIQALDRHIRQLEAEVEAEGEGAS